jgi:hypothetical protein
MNEIPTGRYAILIDSTRVLVRLTRVTQRRYTSVFIAFPGAGADQWGEILVPETKRELYAILRSVDLGAASYLYSCITRKCGVCSNYTCKPHVQCIAKRYGVA